MSTFIGYSVNLRQYDNHNTIYTYMTYIVV